MTSYIKVTTAQMAYALLWGSQCHDNWSRGARQALLDGLTKDERRDAIGWLIESYGPISDGEMIAADIRLGTFPQRSYTSHSNKEGE